MSDQILKEAKRLYDLGFAILWLKPKAKNPVENEWTAGPRKSWDYLLRTYKPGFNVGVRTGAPSKLKNGYLACIDIDIKDERYIPIIKRHLKELIGTNDLPCVLSGSGHGSRHLYCATKDHFRMKTIIKEKGRFEICVYSDGRQMVLPPSIHPTGGRYKWKQVGALKFPVLEFSNQSPEKVTSDNIDDKAKEGDAIDIKGFKFTPVTVDVDWLPISDRLIEGIKSGQDVVDRSSFLLPVVSALKNAGLSENEVLSLLTDPKLYLSGCAYDHAVTKNRKRAALWLWKYTVQKVFSERPASEVFASCDDQTVKLNKADEAKQTKEFLDEIDWTQYLEHTKGGKIVSTVQNVVLILENHVKADVVRRNEFLFRDAYSVDTPWGGEKDASLTDDDSSKIKHWFGQTWGFEPNKTAIDDALIVIACKNAFDPVRDWLDQLPPWDGVRRLDTWLIEHFEAQGDPEYLAQVFRKWLTAMVMRVYRPGAKFDWMPIFEGAQGIGKSSFGRVLVGDQYFLDWLPNLGDKDAALGLQGMWAVEMGELSQFRKNELETIKAFLTRQVDKFRPPHGKKLIESPRRCVFFGTTNKSEYLRDDSGNRRFKPVMVGRLDFECLRRERIQLFAEAKTWAKKANTLDLELNGKARIFEAQLHQEKMFEDESTIMREALDDFLRNPGDFKFDKFRISDLFERVGGPLRDWRPDTRNIMFAAKMIKKCGGSKRFINGRVFWKLPGFDRKLSE